MQKKILERLVTQNAKLDAIYTSTEKTRKYFLWTLIISIVMIILPLIGLMIAVLLLMDTMFGGVSDIILPQVSADANLDTSTMNTLLQELSATAKLLQ